jgi:hypothetical protein
MVATIINLIHKAYLEEYGTAQQTCKRHEDEGEDIYPLRVLVFIVIH